MLQNHVLKIVDPREVEPGIGLTEHLVIGPKLVELFFVERDSATMENHFK
jgi:hypothetical protein